MAEFQYHDTSFRLACIYAPNRNPERNDFFAYCESIVDASVPTLLCGDFNAVFDRTLDRRGSNVSDHVRVAKPCDLSLKIAVLRMFGGSVTHVIVASLSAKVMALWLPVLT